ncbi:MAG TPA: hypothetical protein VFL16_18315 [Steroidobacteraceae bacterium]|nr:hypothetical protein [Steroidobacteraceae bacterium]
MTIARRSRHAKTLGALLCLAWLPAMADIPTIVMTHGNDRHESTIGTSCWKDPDDAHDMCDDHFGVVTSSTPIAIRRNDTVTFEIPLRDHLEEMLFSITRVTRKDIRQDDVDKEFPQFITWKKETRPRKMTRSQLQSIVINQPPGDYILELYGWWKDYGDASHGFYLRVTN